MRAFLSVTYSILSYLFFVATFVYFIGFVCGLPLPTSVDAGPPAPVGEAILIDLALLAMFGIQHSVMARASFKRAWTSVVPQVLERSTFVLASTFALALILRQWRPIAQPVIWEFTGAPAWALQGLFWLGWAVMLASSLMIDHFELFGLSDVCYSVLKLRRPRPEFRTPLFYRWVRHPLYTGLLIAFWATPRMTAGHLLFAAGFTAYIFIGIWFEERDLVKQFGSRYVHYRRTVGMLLPRGRGAA